MLQCSIHSTQNVIGSCTVYVWASLGGHQYINISKCQWSSTVFFIHPLLDLFYLPVHRSVVAPVSVEKGHNIWIKENRSYNDSDVVMHTFEWRWGNCVDAWSLTRPRSLPIFFLNTVDPIRRKSHMVVNWEGRPAPGVPPGAGTALVMPSLNPHA